MLVLQIIQKASAGFEKAKENEKELRKELVATQKKAEKDSAAHAQLLRDAKEEIEKLQAVLAEQKKQSAETEQNLRSELVASNFRAEAEHDKAVLEVTDYYRAQMPAVKDAIWEAAWERCLTKLGVDKASPHWTNMELPSETVSVQVPLTLQDQSNPELQPETALERIQLEDVASDPTPSQAAVGNELYPDPTTDASLLSKEA
jgi:hypothetical protein